MNDLGQEGETGKPPLNRIWSRLTDRTIRKGRDLYKRQVA